MITQVSDSLNIKIQQAFEEKSMMGLAGPGSLRQQAYEKFVALGFPTMKNEDWKYTNLQTLLNNKDLSLLENGQSMAYSLPAKAYEVAELDAYQLFFINGRLDESRSDSINIEGVQVLSFQEAQGTPVFEQHFAAYADKTDSAMVALNTALADGGVFIHVARNVVLDKPIHLIRVSSSSDPVFTLSRNLFVMEAFAEAEILESFVSADDENHALNINNQVTEIALAENAKLQHYMIQTADPNSKYVSHIEVHQRKHSLYNNYNANFPGSDFVRNDINVRMDDPEVESHLYGLLLLNKDQFVDNHTIVDHMMPHGESYEWYKTITQDASTAVFNGKIFVREDAQKTNAFQQNNNVQIGERSSVYSKPQLEIFADDVKCSHGCTIGQFDDESLFYLRSRGIGEDKARVLLVQAFAFDVTSRFENEVIRKHVEKLIEKNLD
ncbi:MAG TPA: Fe-S cluster assembly protein SufD [Sphingobacteriaceae bacterium]|nr:Fe-S cluster assembly protein SufD [Sphingobacteriaceae bacterium]